MKISALERRELLMYMEKYDFSIYLHNKTFLVTGAGGMTGTAIVKWLLLENEIHKTNIKIYASTRYPEKGLAYLDANDPVLYCKFGNEEIALKDIHIDYIIHGAAPTGRSFFVANPVETFDVIVNETFNLLGFTRKNADCRFLYLSSMDVYGLANSENAIDETYVGAIDNLNIRNGYPLGKKGGEFLCKAFFEEYHTDTVMIRPASIQGLFQPYDEPRVFNEILRCIIEEKNLLLKSDGMVKKCFLYTLDAVTAIFTVLFCGKTGEVYNATNPETFLPLRELARHVFQRFCPKLRIEFDKQDEATTGFLPTFSFVQDNSKLNELGWQPLKTIDEIYAVDVERFCGKMNYEER